MSGPLDAAWKELEADALASDGPIRDSDVKDAIKRNRQRIEEAARPVAPSPEPTPGLREAAWDVVLQQGRFTPGDEDNLLAVVPTKALDRLRAALNREDRA